MKLFPLVPLCSLGLLLVSCSDSQEKSRATLHQQKLDFSVDDYYQAAREGKLEAVRTFLDAGMNVDVADPAGNTALLLAAESGHGHVVKELLWRKASANVIREDGDTPLIVAARRGDSEAVQSLLDAGADPEAQNKNDLTALAEAAMEGNASAAALLAPKSRHSLDYALQLAAVKGRTDVVDILLKNGANALARSSENRTPLMYAAKFGHEDAARLLMERGSNLLALDNDLKTAAMLADDAGFPAVSAILNEPPAETPASAVAATTETLAQETTGTFGVAIAASSDAPALPASAAPKRPSVEPASKLAGGKFEAPPEMKSTGDLAQFLKFDSYRERQWPFVLQHVSENSEEIQVQMLTGDHETVTVRSGETIPGTEFEIVGATHRLKAAKAGKGSLVDVSTLLVRHRETGERVLAQMNLPVTSADSFGVIRTSDGTSYEVHPGDTFNVGAQQFKVIDVRPTQVLVEDLSSKETVILQ